MRKHLSRKRQRERKRGKGISRFQFIMENIRCSGRKEQEKREAKILHLTWRVNIVMSTNKQRILKTVEKNKKKKKEPSCLYSVAED